MVDVMVEASVSDEGLGVVCWPRSPTRIADNYPPLAQLLGDSACVGVSSELQVVHM